MFKSKEPCHILQRRKLEMRSLNTARYCRIPQNGIPSCDEFHLRNVWYPKHRQPRYYTIKLVSLACMDKYPPRLRFCECRLDSLPYEGEMDLKFAPRTSPTASRRRSMVAGLYTQNPGCISNATHEHDELLQSASFLPIRN